MPGAAAGGGADRDVGSDPAPRVVVVDPAARGAGLLGLLGEARAAQLRTLMHERAVAWARAGFGGGSERVSDLPHAFGGVGDPRPLVVVVPALGAWPRGLAAAVLDDLAAGCAVSVGVVHEGGVYLLAVGAGVGSGGADAGPRVGAPDLDLAAIEWTGRQAMASLFDAAATTGAEVGLLRVERGLSTEADVRAQLADPLTDGELRDLLR